MTTGITNSQSNNASLSTLQNKNALPQATTKDSATGVHVGQVIRSGETLATTQAALTDKNSKTYHHMVPGAQFIMPDGLSIRFMGGQFTTNDPDIIKELDKVADKPTSQIYTTRESKVRLAETTNMPAQEVLKVAKEDKAQQ